MSALAIPRGGNPGASKPDPGGAGDNIEHDTWRAQGIAMTRNEAPPPDLEMRVRTFPDNGRTRLSYTWHSPAGTAPFFQQEIAGPVLQGSPEDYHARLLQKLGNLAERLDVDRSELLDNEIERRLVSLGHQLWRELFPPELRSAYRELRRRPAVKTWLLVSDEPWIPWELIKPFDDSRTDDPIDDDFLALRFELTRWLAGDKVPAPEIGVRRLAAIRTAEELPQSGGELTYLTGLAGRTGLETVPRTPVSVDDLLEFLETGDAEALHFLGHGRFTVESPDDSPVSLPDGSFFRPVDLEGPRARRIGRARLVVQNICWGAQQGWSLTRTGGWASHWVGVAGCGAFIAPLWAVRDQIALAFTSAFYDALAQGATLGQAGLAARRHLHELRPGDPSTLAYVIYGHPNARVRLGAGATEPDTPFVAHVPPGIREKIRSFNLLIARKTEDFVGRQWLFDAIDGFTQRESRGYVQILGDPGIGKTTLIAELVKRHRHPHHFNIRAEGIQKPDQFLPNLCAQLVAQFGLPYSTLPPETSRDASFLLNLLEKAAAKLRPSGRKLLILVDALDESDPTSVTRGSNTLYLPSDLPDGVFLVVTSRRGGPPLRYTCGEHKIDLQKESANNFADIREFTEKKWLAREGIQTYIRHQGLDGATFVDEIVRLSEGNFMYLHYVLPEIEKGTYRDRSFAELPAGLQNYYEDQWVRMREGDRDAWFDYKVKVLQALTIAREPISLALISGFSQEKRPERIQEVLQEWDGFLHRVEVEEDGAREPRWRLYHDSFHDFIAAKDQVHGEDVNLKQAHGKAADSLWASLYPEG